MKSGKQKGVLIPAVLVSLVCTVALSAFCMFIQVGMTMQAQDEEYPGMHGRGDGGCQ